jgi:hypothetical protein
VLRGGVPGALLGAIRFKSDLSPPSATARPDRRSPGPAAQAVGRGQLVGDRLDLLARPRRATEIGRRGGFLELVPEVGDAPLVLGRRARISDGSEVMD